MDCIVHGVIRVNVIERLSLSFIMATCSKYSNSHEQKVYVVSVDILSVFLVYKNIPKIILI